MPCYHLPPCPTCVHALKYTPDTPSPAWQFHWRADDATKHLRSGQAVFSKDNAQPRNGEWVVKGKRFVPFGRHELFAYYRNTLPFSRHLYESLRSGMPYKPIFDLDRPLITTDMTTTVADLQLLYSSKFLPVVAAFFTEELGVPVGMHDLYSMDASLESKKFSKHLVVSVAHQGKVMAYTDRADEICLMTRFRETIEQQAQQDPALSRFYYFVDKGGDLCTVVDYAIYHHGKRDMRLVGSCKAAGKRKGKPLRTLVPENAQDRPVCDWLCNTFDGPVVPIAVRGPVNAAPPGRSKKKRKRNGAPPQQKKAADGGTVYTGRLERPMRALAALAGGQKDCARVVRTADGRLCVPVNYSKGADGVRRCLFMVRHSRHWSQITYNPEKHRIDYYCHGCAVSVPLYATDNTGGSPTSAIATKAKAVGLKYERVQGRYLPPLDMGLPTRETLLLRSGMGSGKTTRIAEYLQQISTDLSILCIGYRRVLNTALATKFGLVDYQQVSGGDLSNIDRLCVQVDSLPRLLAMDDESTDKNKRRLRSVYDVVVVDEVESTLDHFAGSTVESKVLVCWKLFSVIVARATKLIVADADASDRALAVVGALRRSTTGTDVPRLIDNTNSDNSSEMCECFVWMPSLTAFVERAVDILVQGRRVYLASNSRIFAHSFKALVLAAVARRPGARPLRAEEVLLIDRNVPETEKRRVCECNTTWLAYQLVICTPTVGAGIDFNVKGHFHATFVYATDRSTTPREVNQQRGRVRYPVDKRCYLLIDTHYMGLRSNDVEELERRLERRATAVVTDLVLQHNDGGNNDWLGITLSKTPQLLLRLLAVHQAEVNTSRNNMRSALYKLLRSKYPKARHVLLRSSRTDASALQRQHAEALRYKVAQAEELALQAPLLPCEAAAMTTMVITGDDADEPLAKQRLHMQAIRDFYPYHDEGDWGASDILGIGSDVFRQRVQYATHLLCSDDDVSGGKQWKPLHVGGAVSFFLAHRTALERQEPMRVKQALFALLVFFAGLDGVSLATRSVATVVACFSPRARFHSALAHERIAQHPEMFIIVANRFGFSNNETNITKKRRQVRAALRQHLASNLGIRVIGGSCHKHTRDLQHGATSSCSRVWLDMTDVAGLMAAVHTHTAGTHAGVVAGGLAILHVYTWGGRPPLVCALRGVGMSTRPAPRAPKIVNEEQGNHDDHDNTKKETNAFAAAAREVQHIMRATESS